MEEAEWIVDPPTTEDRDSESGNREMSLLIPVSDVQLVEFVPNPSQKNLKE